MNFSQFTVSGFFGRKKATFIIPAYQRAYSWEEQQLRTFLEDLSEHGNAGQNNPYYYGNILLETISQDKKYEIIDGQQRLTTISIFMRALLNTLKKKMQISGPLSTSDGEEIDIADEEEVYLKDNVIKLRPTQHDQGCYDTLIIENKSSFNCITPAQKRILFAKGFFERELSLLSEDKLVNIFEIIRKAIINSIELTGKKESALMFELQNNRGKELTNLEKLKSFLMYQAYVYSDPGETEVNIEYISNQFDPIYTIVNQMSLQLGDEDDDNRSTTVNEDNILLYHSYAYNKKNFGYRNLNDIFDEFKSVPKEGKIAWIKNYSVELYTSFSSIQRVLATKFLYLDKIKCMKGGIPFFVYPFIIKGAKNQETLPQLFRLLEVLSFRYKLVNSRADIRGRLNDLIRNFDGDVQQLAYDMDAKMTDAYYWGNAKVLEILNGDMYKNNMLNYLLWEYEQSLQLKGYVVRNISIENESIEHISPRTEDAEICSGYEVGEDGYYTKEYREQYINKLGNLMLISQSHNSSIGNKPFKVKLASYLSNQLLRQQVQINEFVENSECPAWDSGAIDKRHRAMIDFALNRWSYIQ